jgi:hypothetical protein
MYNMHELLHLVGFCPDNISHLDLIDITVANYQNITDIKIKTIIQYVTKRLRSRETTTNKR